MTDADSQMGVHTVFTSGSHPRFDTYAQQACRRARGARVTPTTNITQRDYLEEVGK